LGVNTYSFFIEMFPSHSNVFRNALLSSRNHIGHISLHCEIKRKYNNKFLLFVIRFVINENENLSFYSFFKSVPQKFVAMQKILYENYYLMVLQNTVLFKKKCKSALIDEWKARVSEKQTISSLRLSMNERKWAFDICHDVNIKPYLGELE
jgi:hypothetical protein